MEFALVVTPLLIIVFGIISYGYMLSFRQAISQAAAEGARAGAVLVYPDAGDVEDAAVARMNEALSSYGVTCSGVAPDSALTRDGAPAGTCSIEVDACAGDSSKQCITATVAYEYRDHSLLPTVPGMGVVLPETLRYSAVAEVS
ncbi:TadE family protein [Nocardioides deserti]|uniref:Pilus assembly protein n=1 Tax=Nocardioides deserti TaxID=1588644 RepID=A0ABR6UCU4_9ACTN|nr:TadE family protein [Nocardioides deserti]MBC2962095.1 pilus assembly protein [Nocardioides deserti]